MVGNLLFLFMVDRGKQKFGPNQLQRGRAIFTGTKFVNYNGQYFIWVENLGKWVSSDNVFFLKRRFLFFNFWVFIWMGVKKIKEYVYWGLMGNKNWRVCRIVFKRNLEKGVRVVWIKEKIGKIKFQILREKKKLLFCKNLTLFVDGGGQPPLHVEQPGGQNVKRPVAAKHYGPRYTHVSL